MHCIYTLIFFQEDITDNISGSVSLSLATTSEDEGSDAESPLPPRMSKEKGMPFNHYAKRKHSRSRTDPVRFSTGDGPDSPRYHSDPAVGDSTSGKY